MGMLISRHRARHAEQSAPRARKPRKSRRRAEAKADPATPPETPVTAESVSPYEALTDDELFDAYVTNVGEDGTAESREAMTAELDALDADASE